MKRFFSFRPSVSVLLTGLFLIVAVSVVVAQVSSTAAPAHADVPAAKAAAQDGPAKPAAAASSAGASNGAKPASDQAPPAATAKDAKPIVPAPATVPAKDAKPASPPAAAKDAKPAAPPAAGAKPTAPAPAAKPAAPPTVAEAPLPPLKGSHIPADKNNCIVCHGESDLWDPSVPSQRRLFIAPDMLKKDVHFTKGVNCVDCHGGNYDTQDKNEAHAVAAHFRSKLADIKRFCAACHETKAATISSGAHKGVSCVDCHGGKDAKGKVSPHDISPSMAGKLADQPTFCGSCHAKELLELESNGVHSGLGGKDKQGRSLPLHCTECHSRNKPIHELVPVKDKNSAVFLNNQVQTCGNCHPDRLKTYLESVHGKGMEKMGLNNVAVCSSCHAAHAIFDINDVRSTLNISKVADTCAECHRGIKEQLLTSVHSRGTGLGGKADKPAPGGKTTQLPSCTSCHRGHALAAPESVAFRESEPGSCGNCHDAMSSLYALSMHGKLTDLGYGPAAKCGDCHGAHAILPPDDPGSKLSPAHRADTCGQCHPNAGGKFLAFNPHLDPYDAQKYPVVNFVQITLLFFLYSTFGFFALHSLFWFIRGLVEVLKHGRARGLRPGETAYVRFISFHRIGHTIMMSSFLGLALTGLPLKYHDAPWAKSLARSMGGFPTTSFWHRFFGVILLVSMLVYLARMVRLLVQGRAAGRSLLGMVFGPDSPVPNLEDLKDFLKMLRWFFGLGPKPAFDRWSYWEKIDFWGAIADTVIIGSTGLMLWFPGLFCGPLPGTALNIAAVVHSTQALLATGFVFAIHFFNTHIRPEKFPADMSVLTGLVSEEEFKEERPLQYKRLEQEGKLEALRTASPGLFALTCIRLFGFLALALGLALLVGMIIASLG